MLKAILSLQLGEVATDKAVLVFDGEDLAEGMEVFVRNEDDELNPAEDGDYTTQDGKIIRVVGGKVAAIEDPEAEVATEMTEEVAMEAEANEEPVAEEVVVEPEQIEMEDNTEVEIIDEPETEEEEVSVEDRIGAVETKMEEILGGLNQIVNSLAALETRITDVEGKLAKVEAPAADPIDQEPEVVEEKKSRLSYLRKD